MSIQLLVRQGGGAAAEPDIAAIGGREGLAVFDDKTPIIEMGQRWEQGSASVGSFIHMNPDADDTYLFRPHASVKLIETATTPDTIIAWQRIEGGNDTGRVATYIPGLEVRQSIQTMDCNLDLRGLPLGDEWVRPAEDSWDRLQALHLLKLNGSSSTGGLHRSTTSITVDRFTNGHLVDATDPVDMEAHTYPVGTEVEEILRDIMEQWGKGWGVTIHHTGGSHKCLLIQDYDDLAKFTSALKISDQVADWDPTHATTPVLEPKWARGDGKLIDQSAVISGLISVYGGTEDEPRHLYVETGEAPEDWEIWVDVYHDDLATSETQATRRANHILNDRKRPYVTNRPSILLEPTQVALITAGQAIQVKSVVINQNSAGPHDYVWRRIAEIRWEPNYDGRWWAHLELDRPRNSHPISGGGTPGSTSPKPAPECTEQEPDTETILSDSRDGDWGATVTTGTCWGGDPHRSIGGSGQYGPSGGVAVSAGDVIRGTVEFRDETGDDSWENVDNYNYEAYLQFTGTSMPTLSYLIINERFHNAGCIDVTRSTTQTVPTGYTSARVQIASRLGGYQFNGWISEVTFATPVEDDEFCLPSPTGTSPFYARSDDPRFEADDQHLVSKLKQRVVNNSGGLLSAGDIVIPDITYDGQAVTTTTTASLTAARVGVIESDVADGETGVVIWEGSFVGDIVVNDGAATSADGDYLYTSTTAGAAAVSGTRTTGAFGRVIRDDAGDPQYVLLWGVPDTAGTSISELDDIPDVNAPTPANGDVLTWDSTPGEWVAQAPGGGSTIIVQEADSTVEAAATTLDFGNGLDVTSSPAGEANIVVDESELDVTNLGGYPGGSVNFLRADGTFQDPTAGGGTVLGYAARAEQRGFQVGFVALSSAFVLAANGGTVLFELFVPSIMNVEQVRLRNTDTGTARAWRWDIYQQVGATNSLTRVVASNGSESFTPAGAASVRTLAAASAPVVLAPGIYWMAVQSTHASSSFGIGSTAGVALAGVAVQTKTTTNPNGATLDATAATWVKQTSGLGVIVDGRVFGESTPF